MKMKRIISLFIIMFIGFITFGTKKVNATVSISDKIVIDGAQIRTVGTQGLRFVADKTDYVGEVSSWGILIAYGEVEATNENFVVGGSENINGKTILTVEMNTLNDKGKFAATIINIPSASYIEKVTARAYVKLSDGSYVYSQEVVTRSVYQIAKLDKASIGYVTNEYIENVITVGNTTAPKKVDVNGNPDQNGNYVLFGSYPQTKVTDVNLINTLTTNAGNLPTDEDDKNWTSYKYHIEESNTVDFMWYIDLTENNVKYRGVYFTSNRPWSREDKSKDTYQLWYDYSINNIYWFKYEPIKWKIITSANGETTILSDILLDSQEFTHNQHGTNNYNESSIRTWLNADFYNTAFSLNQKWHISTSEVDNSASSTSNPDNNTYACENTFDKIWLLSYQDVNNAAYGFTDDASKMKYATDYSKCMGVYVHPEGNYDSMWLLRSPNNAGAFVINSIHPTGRLSTDHAHDTCLGLAPVLKFND